MFKYRAFLSKLYHRATIFFLELSKSTPNVIHPNVNVLSLVIHLNVDVLSPLLSILETSNLQEQKHYKMTL